jgi:hypothetical protein
MAISFTMTAISATVKGLAILLIFYHISYNQPYYYNKYNKYNKRSHTILPFCLNLFAVSAAKKHSASVPVLDIYKLYNCGYG